VACRIAKMSGHLHILCRVQIVCWLEIKIGWVIAIEYYLCTCNFFGTFKLLSSVAHITLCFGKPMEWNIDRSNVCPDVMPTVLKHCNFG